MTGLVPHNPAWSKQASALANAIREATRGSCAAIHHIGSTAVPGLAAKPVIDLLLVIRQPDRFDRCRPPLERLGYEWMGEFGLPGRRYLRRDAADTGLRLVQAHGYVVGSPEIARHLAFRDLLRRDRPARNAYATVKQACIAQFPDDHVAYGLCKSPLIDQLESTALATPTGVPT